MDADHGIVVIDQFVAQRRSAGEIVAEPGIGMLAAIRPVVEGVIAPQPVIVFHIAGAETGRAAFEAGAETSAEIDRNTAAQDRRPGLPDQMADRIVAADDLLVALQIHGANAGLNPHGVVGCCIADRGLAGKAVRLPVVGGLSGDSEGARAEHRNARGHRTRNR